MSKICPTISEKMFLNHVIVSWKNLGGLGIWPRSLSRGWVALWELKGLSGETFSQGFVILSLTYGQRHTLWFEKSEEKLSLIPVCSALLREWSEHSRASQDADSNFFYTLWGFGVAQTQVWVLATELITHVIWAWTEALDIFNTKKIVMQKRGKLPCHSKNKTKS